MASKNDILIIDYKMGNIGSVLNMLKKIGANVKVSSDVSDLAKAKKLILPGVGAFDHGMNSLNELNLVDILNKKVLIEKIPILGICLGMQILTLKSEEGTKNGLAWIEAETIKFDLKQNIRIPHMGWNTLIKIQNSDLFNGIDIHNNRFYFVHSYYVKCNNEKNIAAVTHYGEHFASSIRHENIYGTQFHPEKSHKFGMKILSNFLEI